MSAPRWDVGENWCAEIRKKADLEGSEPRSLAPSLAPIPSRTAHFGPKTALAGPKATLAEVIMPYFY